MSASTTGESMSEGPTGGPNSLQEGEVLDEIEVEEEGIVSGAGLSTLDHLNVQLQLDRELAPAL